MEQSNGFNFPQTTREKVVQYIFAGGAGLAVLGGLYLLLPIIVSVLTGMVVGLKLLILGGGLLAILFAMLTLKGPFMTAMKVLAKKAAIKFLRLMPVEHLEIIYDAQQERVRDIGEVSQIIHGNAETYRNKIREFEARAVKAERAAQAAHARGMAPEFQAQAGIAAQFRDTVEKYEIELQKLERLAAMLRKIHDIAKAMIKQLEVRKEIAADQWNQVQSNARANNALRGLFGGGPEMQMFEDAERFIRDECAGSFGELGAIFDQAQDIMSQFELGQAVASDELLAKFSERVDRLGHDTPSFQIPTNLDVVDAEYVPAQPSRAAVTKFIPR